jgi:molecular chaperone DnaK
LKDAHKSGDVNAIDSAINELNSAWQSASEKMYAQGAQQAGPQMNENVHQQTQNTSEPDIQDADFEEVK